MANFPAPELPGGARARRTMHFFWLLDGSSSMAGEKIQALNFAVGEAIAPIRRVAESVPEVRLLVRALRFATDVDWIVREPTPIAEFQWHDIAADGDTAMGKAVNAVVDELDRIDVTQRFFRPVILLVTDGRNTDGKLYNSALGRLMSHPLGRMSQRCAIAIGSDASIEELKAFLGDDKTPVFEAGNGDMLQHFIEFGSVSAIKIASEPAPHKAEAMVQDMAAEAKAGLEKVGRNSWVW